MHGLANAKAFYRKETVGMSLRAKRYPEIDHQSINTPWALSACTSHLSHSQDNFLKIKKIIILIHYAVNKDKCECCLV